MSIKVLHYIYNGPPIASGYTLRTQSIIESQKKIGISANAALSLKSLLSNYFRNINFNSKNIVGNITYYSAHNHMVNDLGFNLLKSLLLLKNERIKNRLIEKYYSVGGKKILSEYSNFLFNEIGDIDLIHSHSPSITFNEASLINQYFKKKLIYEVRGFWNLSLEKYEQDIMESVKDEIEACKKADKCIAICNGIADILIKGGIPKNKIEIVPNGVDPNKFIPVEKDLELLRNLKLEDKIIFGYITSVRWLEGIQTVIKAWRKILKEVPNAVFLLIGSGNYLENIKSMIKEYGIEESFLTLGKVEHKKISSYYSLLDIFIVPRLNIPVSHIVTPLKPLEAMANGKSLIVSDVNALKEMVIDGETGLHFKADDDNHLADISIKLAKDEALRKSLALNARSWVIKNRTWENISKQYSEIYNRVLN